LDFAAISNDQLLRFLKEQIARLVTEDPFISNFARHSAHNTFIIHSAGDYLRGCVLAIAEMVRAGSFKPSFSEVSFGGKSDSLGEYTLSLPNGRILSLAGKIDRIDVTEHDSDKAAIIFDYKRKPRSFSWSEFYHGLDMQLPIYITAIRHTARLKIKNAVGAFYMPVEVTPAAMTLGEISEKSGSLSYKAKGIFNGEFAQYLDKQVSKDSKFYNYYVTKDGQPYGIYENRGALKPADFEKVLTFTGKKIVGLVEKILSGKIDVNPYRLAGKSPCSFCKYKSVCRFDWQINDYNFLEMLNKLQCLDKMGTADA
jgi:ATP-dependent helicase/nuclease subunit B